MKKIGNAETISDYNQQISYLEEVLSVLEDLQILYGKDDMFKDDYKEVQGQMTWIEEVQDNLKDEKNELLEAEIKEDEKQKMGMIYEFQRERL